MMSAHGCRGPISSGSRGEAVMPADVHIRNNATGETRIYRDDFSGSDEPFDVWQWTDGNYGCDCNRSLFFMRAGGESPSVTDPRRLRHNRLLGRQGGAGRRHRGRGRRRSRVAGGPISGGG